MGHFKPFHSQIKQFENECFDSTDYDAGVKSCALKTTLTNKCFELNIPLGRFCGNFSQYTHVELFTHCFSYHLMTTMFVTSLSCETNIKHLNSLPKDIEDNFLQIVEMILTVLSKYHQARKVNKKLELRLSWSMISSV